MADLSRATDPARLVLRLAHRRTGALDRASSVALLHATLDVPWCVAARSLTALGVTPEAIGRVSGPPAPAADPDGFDVAEAGVAEAARCGSRHVGTEHLLLGLIRDGGTGAARILSARGVTPERLEEAVSDCLSSPRPPLMLRARVAALWQDVRWLLRGGS